MPAGIRPATQDSLMTATCGQSQVLLTSETTTTTAHYMPGLSVQFTQPLLPVKVTFRGAITFSNTSLGANTAVSVAPFIMEIAAPNTPLKTAFKRQLLISGTTGTQAQPDFAVTHISAVTPGTLVTYVARAYINVGAASTWSASFLCSDAGYPDLELVAEYL